MSEDGYREAQTLIRRAHKRGLRTLDLGGLALTQLPPEIGQLSALRILYLDQNQLTELPTEVTQLIGLEALSVFNNRLKQLPARIARLTALESLNFSNNQLTQLPTEIAQLTALQSLSLANNQLSELPPSITQLSKLEILDISNNNFARLPPEVVQLTALISLDLSSNKDIRSLTGISLISKLKFLNLSNNHLDGLPPEILRIATLRSLYLRNNQITSIPSEIVQLNALQELSLANNLLTQLPPEIAQLTALRSLDLDSNQLTQLPPEIALLTALRSLRLGGNRLASLPKQLETMRQLQDAAESDSAPYTKGLFIADNPLPAPYSRLISPGQPAATRNVLAWLRGELDPDTLPADTTAIGTSAEPPALPAQGAGGHVVLDEQGLIAFAPSGDLDRKGNNLPRLRSLHPELQDMARLLVEALDQGNRAHHALLARARAYQRLIDLPLDQIEFALLFVAGLRLANAAYAARTAIAAGDLPLLTTEVDEALASLLQVHGPFILATRDGQEALAEEARYRRTPDEEEAYRAVLYAFADAVRRHPGIARPDVADALSAQPEEIGRGDNSARSGVVGGGLARNVSILSISTALAMAFTAVPMAAFGPAGGLLGAPATLAAVEAIKKSKAFEAVRDGLARYLDNAAARPSEDPLSGARRHRDFVLENETVLRRLADQGGGFGWISDALDWLNRRSR